MVEIRTDLIPVNRFSRPGRRMRQVKGVVLHYTAARRATAQNIRNAFARLARQDPDDETPDRSASAHFAVDDREIVLCLPENELAYHVGARRYTDAARQWLGPYPNATTLGIEMCIDANGEISPATVTRTLHLTVHLCRKYGLDHTDLWRHYDITGKICPKPWVDNEAAWTGFVGRVRGELYLKGMSFTQRWGCLLRDVGP